MILFILIACSDKVENTTSENLEVEETENDLVIEEEISENRISILIQKGDYEEVINKLKDNTNYEHVYNLAYALSLKELGDFESYKDIIYNIPKDYEGFMSLYIGKERALIKEEESKRYKLDFFNEIRESGIEIEHLESYVFEVGDWRPDIIQGLTNSGRDYEFICHDDSSDCSYLMIDNRVFKFDILDVEDIF